MLNLKNLVQQIESTDSEYLVFKNKDGQELVLDRAKVEKEGAEILETYRIHADRSMDLKSLSADGANQVSK